MAKQGICPDQKKEELVNSASKTAFQVQLVYLHSCRLLLALVMEPPKVDYLKLIWKLRYLIMELKF